MSLRARWRRTAFGLATLLTSTPRGFFIPYRYAPATAPPARYPQVERVLAEAEPEFRAWLARAASHAESLRHIGVDDAPPAPRWGQDWFPRLDAAIAYAIVRELRPRRVVEIGSGHSTRFLARAIADGGLATALVAIDPAPRADLAGLPIDLRLATLQQVLAQGGEASPFDALGPGDIVLIDSSHVLMPGSDVDLLLNDLLPALPSGAVVHFHDVVLPDGYPARWAWRGYNEQNAVAQLVLSRQWRPLFASHHVRTRLAREFGATPIAGLHLREGAQECSLWLAKA